MAAGERGEAVKPLEFRIQRWAAWAPGFDAGEVGPVPMLLRRRVSPLGQQALRAAWSLPDSAQARMVFSSRHGEFGRTLSILDALIRRDGVSPADFTLSVHHALVGLLSIAQHNRQGHTAVAAGSESFCFGLMEAVACLADNPAEPVVLLHCDEPLPEPFGDHADGAEPPLAVALSLAAAGEGEGMSLTTAPAVADAPRAASHALDFLGFLRSGAAEATSAGERLQWCWRRHAAA